jgi:large repetitive protein
MRFTRILTFVALIALVAVPTALALRFTDDSYNLPLGVTGQSYSHTFQGEGGCGPALPYQYRLLNSTLPSGLTLDKSGLLHGTPQVSGKYDFWVELSDEDPPSASWCNPPKKAERLFTINIIPGLNIQQNTLNPKAAFANAPYNFQLTAEGGGTQSWSIISGALPAGLALNSSNGAISGTPTATGDFTFKIQVTDGGRTDSETYTLAVVEQLRITAPKKQATEIGLPYSLTLVATGGRPGYIWGVAPGSNLPAGLTLDPATGVINGGANRAGIFQMRISVTDTLGLSSTLDVPMTVAARLAITKKALPAAKVGKKYKARFLARGGVAPTKWIILGGRPGLLPAGIKLNAKTGELSGTPTKAGTFRLRMQVTDKLGIKSALGFVLKVNA